MTSSALRHLPVLCIDCQTTGASPDKGHIIDIAWQLTTADGASRGDENGRPAFESRVRLPDDAALPRRIQRMTGITPDELAGAPAPPAIHRLLAAEVGRTDVPPVFLAHYARFERAFIDDLDAHAGDGDGDDASDDASDRDAPRPSVPQPCEWLCTHAIMRRLHPSLPRCGLRAAAGYYGHVVEDTNRAAGHVQATLFVWRHLVDALERDHGVTTLEELHEWLAQGTSARPARREYPLPRERRLSLPDAAGVYHMLGRGGQVLYIGKATSLRQRVNSYFRSPRSLPSAKLELVSQVFDVRVVETDTPLEAALLENDHIKHHAPPYNAALMADGRELTFLSARLDRTSPRPEGDCRFGPLVMRPDSPPFALPGALLVGAADRSGPMLAPEALPAFLRDCDPAALEAGAGLLRERHALRPGPLQVLDLVRLGTRLWIERELERAALLTSLDDDADDDEMRDDGTRDALDAVLEHEPEALEIVTPDDVADLLERRIIALAFALRRGRWLCRLSEATIAWQPHSLPGDRQAALRTLTLSGGEIIERGHLPDLDDLDALAVPPGHTLTHRDRQATFTLASYDRLRILTTELRRIVARDGDLLIRFAPGRTLSGENLRRMLAHV